MTAKKPEMRHLRGLLATVNSQRVEYKPYNYALSFGETVKDFSDAVVAPLVLVEFDIPEEYVVDSGPDFVVLGLDGLKAVLRVTADAIDALNDEFKKSKGA